MLDIKFDEVWNDRIVKIFMTHFYLCGAKYFSSSHEQIDIKPQLLLEASNSLASVELQIVNSQQLRIVLGERLVTKSISYILYRLWELVRSGGVQYLNVSLRIETSKRFLEMLQSPSADIDVRSKEAMILFTGVSLALADHFTFRDINKAIQRAESCANFMLAGDEPWNNLEAKVVQAFSLTLRAFGQIPRLSTRLEKDPDEACQCASEALDILAPMLMQLVKLTSVRDYCYLNATSILKHMAPLSTDFRSNCDEYDEDYDAALEQYEHPVGDDSTGFGAPMALTKQLARRDWWFQQLGVNQQPTCATWKAESKATNQTSGKCDKDTEVQRLLSDLRLAMSAGDKLAEFRLQDSLILYYEGKKDWKTAAEHIIELHKLAAEAAAIDRDQYRHPIDLSTFNNFDNRLQHGCILIEAENFEEAQRLYDTLINDVMDTCDSKEEAEEKTDFIPGKTWTWLMKQGSSWDVIMQGNLSLNIGLKIRQRWP